LDVCGGNALTLFRPEEIEMMVCGSRDLDVYSLEAVTSYDGFRRTDRIIRDFWDIMNTSYSTELRRKLLLFVTGTDRMPATGPAKFFKISKLGRDCNKLPIAHTCFNQLCLWDYNSKQKLQQKLTQAITESSGFNLK
jgi:E3 ubiquitin-protein ligase HECTD2